MAEVRGKILCPVCSATSGKDGFGADLDGHGKPFRKVGRSFQKSEDPKHVERRAKADRIRQQNAAA